MELEAKLDEDFLFYLGFTNSFLHKVTDPEIKHRCELWLRKLCGEACNTAKRKRSRNIYLSHLLLCMQTGNLERQFLVSPNDVDIENADEVFDPLPPEVQEPEWLEDTNNIPQGSHKEKKGRTYLATRTLPHGQGAFAYIGISMTEDEPMWIGAGEGLDSHMEQQFREQVPPIYEMEKILARRKDPKERQRVLTFYDALLEGIADELDGKGLTDNETVEGLMEQLINDLKEKEAYVQYEELSEIERRQELLLLLHDRVQARREKVAKREEVLDHIEEKIMPKSFWEDSVLPEDKYELPAAMWEQAINKAPNKRLMKSMNDQYPVGLIDKFLELLSNHKEQIAMRMQRRHENLVAQMKKEMRKEGDKMRKWVDEQQIATDQACEVMLRVKEQYMKKHEAEERNKKKTEVPVSEHTKIYEKMREFLYDTQRLVEEEAAKGRFLAAQINAVTDETEIYAQVNDEIVRKTEVANMQIMKNIKKLRLAINSYEKRISDIQQMGARGAEEEMFIF